MLIFELITSLSLFMMIFIPINSYVINLGDNLPFDLINKISNQTFVDMTNIINEELLSSHDLCHGYTSNNYYLDIKDIVVKSTSTEATSIISDGTHIFIGLNSASTTDYDLIVYNYNDLSKYIDKIDSGPGINAITFMGSNLFVINSSINSAIQVFKFNMILKKVGDYKIPWSSSANPVYASKISYIYPNIFVGMKKNNEEELVSMNINNLGVINNRWEFDSSVQAVWPIYDSYFHLLISFAKEPEINDICLNCTASSSFDLSGSLGNVRSLIYKDKYIYVGRSAGNNELFKIKRLDTSYEIVNSIDINDGVYSMLLFDNSLVVVSGKNNSKIQIRDSDNPSNLIQSIDTNISIADIECVGNRMFGVGYNNFGDHISPVIFELKNK